MTVKSKEGTDVENLLKEGNNDVNRKVFGQNIERRSQKHLKHPLISKAPLHVCENPPSMHFVGKKKPKWDTQNLDVIQRALKIDKRKETKR
jgi:hypothetical protein